MTLFPCEWPACSFQVDPSDPPAKDGSGLTRLTKNWPVKKNETKPKPKVVQFHTSTSHILRSTQSWNRKRSSWSCFTPPPPQLHGPLRVRNTFSRWSTQAILWVFHSCLVGYSPLEVSTRPASSTQARQPGVRLFNYAHVRLPIRDTSCVVLLLPWELERGGRNGVRSLLLELCLLGVVL